MLYSNKEEKNVSNGCINGLINGHANGTYVMHTSKGHDVLVAPIEIKEKPYENPRLDPANYLNGPLSLNPATRLRQMLARPGIVVCIVDTTLLAGVRILITR